MAVVRSSYHWAIGVLSVMDVCPLVVLIVGKMRAKSLEQWVLVFDVSLLRSAETLQRTDDLAAPLDEEPKR